MTSSTNTPSTDVEVDTKLNSQLSSHTKNIFLYKYYEGKANRIFTPYDYNSTTHHHSKFGESQVIIDSRVTRHMWNDLIGFITYKPIKCSFVFLTNKQKVTIDQSGTIQININGFTLRIHEVYHIPPLAYSSYSVKQHMTYGKCFTYFGNNNAVLQVWLVDKNIKWLK